MRKHSMWLGNQGQMFASSSLESKTQNTAWRRRVAKTVVAALETSFSVELRHVNENVLYRFGPICEIVPSPPYRKGDHSIVWEREHTVTAKLSHLPGFSDMGFVQKVEDDLSSRVRLWG